jgi:hypothetical protein
LRDWPMTGAGSMRASTDCQPRGGALVAIRLLCEVARLS